MATDGSLDSHYSAPMEEVGPAFRIGKPEVTNEYFFRGARIFEWQVNGHERQFAELAGWSDLPHGVTDGIGHIGVPEGTRNATGVLGGMEAWEGEKAGVVDHLVQYSRMTKEVVGAVDVGASFDTVAITKDRKMFITPPHNPARDPVEIGAWIGRLAADLNQILPAGDYRQNIIDRFTEGTADL